MQDTSSKILLSINLPSSWQELNEKQLEFVFKLVASGVSACEMKIVALLRWTKIKPVFTAEIQGEVMYAIKHEGKKGLLTLQQLTDISEYLKWMEELPTYPLRPEKMGRHRAVAANFEEVPFQILLMVDNFYQGYIRTKDDELLDEIGQMLYNCEGKVFKPWQRVAIFYWVASLKDYLARKYTTFFQPAAGTALAPQSIEQAMNTQIRALTKGDITKEKEVLAMDCHRALAELEAQAREYEDMKQKYKS